jgi:hypothetical protein
VLASWWPSAGYRGAKCESWAGGPHGLVTALCDVQDRSRSAGAGVEYCISGTWHVHLSTGKVPYLSVRKEHMTMRTVLTAGVCLAALSGCSTSHVRIMERWHLAPWWETKHTAPDEIPLPATTHPLLKGHSKSDNFVVTTEEEWRFIWQSVGRTAPPANFRANMIVGVYRIISEDHILGFRISRVEKRDGGIVVWVKEEIPRPGYAGHGTVIGDEVEFILIRRTQLPFVFATEPYWGPATMPEPDLQGE